MESWLCVVLGKGFIINCLSDGDVWMYVKKFYLCYGYIKKEENGEK